VLCVCNPAGHEYYYNDETGDATWRRPRITLSKDPNKSQQTFGDSYNSTQVMSPNQTMSTEWQDHSQDQDETQEQTANETEEYLDEVVSLGDSSAQTDDSKNMCFHVSQDNVDVDIYKVQYMIHVLHGSMSHIVQCISFYVSF
jgi:hypothetical protein